MESETRMKQALGLNSYEARAYFALLGGRMSAKEVSERSGVPLSRTYDTLRSLEAMGFSSEAGGSYQAVRPSVALRSRLGMIAAKFEEEPEERRSAVEDAIRDLKQAFKDGKIPDSMNDDRYYNIKTMQKKKFK